ncbi:amino acid adenylation domain-containing protein [Azomonas agilis]|uniref:Amino acid adenylation domain-containing protein n=1 Tax=Azomonas agilis TaxID=116849 RepID=A0A562HZH6_9GAMM|nr:non-ribosomal peptide synthetase [Azomonas agilis]TWH64187.1 amino acid adenylation domain-containing protein [Azomonas agilis]
MTPQNQSIDDALLALLCELDEEVAAPSCIVPHYADDAPLSFAQEQLWLLNQLDTDATTYNQPRAFLVHGLLRAQDLQNALDRVVDRHDILRTRITEVQGQPRQIVDREARLNLRSVDLRGQSSEALHRALGHEAATPFDLGQAPLLRACLYQLDEQRHVLALTNHHIVSDAWSNPVLLRDLCLAYSNACTGLDRHLQRPAVQYTDFAQWQRGAYLASPAHERAKAYWRDYLHGGMPLLELPTDYPRGSRPATTAGTCTFELPVALFEQLQVTCRSNGLTPFMVLLAAWQLTLGRYSRQDDFILGVPNAGRNQEQVQDLIGFFVNSQIHRARLDPRQSVAELLNQVRRHTLACLEHADHPLEQVVAEHRQGTGSALFHCLFNWTNDHTEQAAPSFANLRIESLPSAAAPAKFDLSLNVQAGYERLYISLDYDTALFEVATAQRLGQDWLAVLQAMLDNPQCAIGALQVQSTEQCDQWLATHQGPEGDALAGLAVHQQFTRMARSQGEAIALVAGDTRLSYQALDAAAERLAYRLRAEGIRPGDRVAVALERGAPMIITLLATLKAGGAYIPLDPQFPAERLAYMLKDCGALLLVTQTSVLATLPAPSQNILLLDSLDLQADDQPVIPLELDCLPQQLAYVLYTSGSTGNPKGVMVPHGALSNFIASMAKAPGLKPGQRLLSITTCSFDIFGLELYLPLCTGACMVLANKDSVQDPAAIIDLLVSEAIDVLQATPSTWRMLLDNDPNQRLPALTALCGGEALSDELTTRLLARCKTLWNLYGPTETTIWSARHALTRNSPRPELGQPIERTGLLLLDSNLLPSPLGVPADLYISGDGLAQGYHQRPGLTAERFVPHPYGQSGERLYRTGDLTRRHFSGSLDFLGRVDHQVKIRGFRIELGEIESGLLAQDAVREAVVIAREGIDGAQLIAYVVPITWPADAQAFTEHCLAPLREYLPNYMVPARLQLLHAMPLTPNGKLDRKALPAVDDIQPHQTQYLAPTNDLQRQVAAIWAELLKAERVGLADDFFVLGGHSLLVARVVSRLRHELGLDFPLRLLFEQPRLSDFCQALAHIKSTTPIVPQAQATVARNQLPLSFAQERQWLLWKLAPTSSAYHIPSVLRLRGPLNITALNHAFDQLIARHESLRTCFTLDNEQLHQNILAPWSLNLQSQELDESQIDTFVAELRGQPFDLASGLLLRVGLARLGANDHLLVLVQHHIVSDAWSMQVMIRELCALYQGQALPPLTLQYADFASWQRRWLEAGERERQLTYWRSRLAGEPPVLELPYDHPRRDHSQRPAGRLYLVLPETTAQALQDFATAYRATIPMVLLSAWQALLHRYTGQSDIRIGVPVANRNRLETEPLIGFFVNTLVLRAECSADLSFEGLLAQTRQAMIEAQDHQDLPYEQLLEELLPRRDPQQTLFQVLYNHHQEADTVHVGELHVQALDSPPLDAQFDLALSTAQGEHGLSASFTYDRDLFDTITLQRLTQHWLNLLEQGLAQPQWPLTRLALMNPVKQLKVQEAWNGPLICYPQTQALAARIEAQAQRQPQAIALRYQGQSLSYAELNRRANRLAHRLIAVGVNADVPVGLVAERGFEMILGLLAILKAGGAYVPLDPAHPVERLAFMIRDSGIKVLLDQPGLLAELPAQDNLLRLNLNADYDDQPMGNPPARSSVDNLAYIIYTSGSTGLPKGTLLSQRNVLRLFSACDRWFSFDHQDVWTLFHSFAFDFSVWEIFGALLHGGRLVIVPQVLSRDPQSFLQLLMDERVTVLNQTPSAFKPLIQMACTASSVDLALRLVIFGGEALDVAALRPWFERFGEYRPQLVNMYGITETTVHVTYRPIALSDLSRSVSPIGELIDDLSGYLLDGELNPVPVGCIGELYIGQAGLARGYLNQAGLTATRFIANPYSRQPGSRLYRTGDLARYRSDGSVEYIGRIDQQVKIRGFRIELGEIKARLLAQPTVAQAVVIADQEQAETRLLAYLVANPGQTPDTAALRASLKTQMPDYMIPTHCVWLDQLPLTLNGKLDYKALPTPADTNAERPFRSPQSPLQQQLADLWQQVLKVRAVGLDDDFFELGGHSLLVINAVSRIQLELGRALAPQDLFQHPTLEALALHLDTRTTAIDESKLDTLEAWLDEMEEH